VTRPARKARAALIDLDGTLLDTAPDLAAAAAATLVELGLVPVPPAQVRDFVGQGLAVLVERCLRASLGREPAPALLAQAQAGFAPHYERLNGGAARVYPGVVEGLEAMRAAGLRLACATNKPLRFAEPLLERTGLHRYFDALATSDLAGARKPDPGVVLYACRALGVAPGEACVIGDSDNDGAAARAAGCRFLLVPYGYREGRELRDIACDAVAATLLEAAALLRD
jgi:phosphoglycolate phosphatase